MGIFSQHGENVLFDVNPFPANRALTSAAPKPKQPAWHALSAAEAAQRLHADPARGLDQDEAARRRAADGPNALRAAPALRPLALLAGQFLNPLVLLLLVAAMVSGFLGEWIDASAIIAIVFLNAAIGFAQEYNAEQAIAALKKMTSPKATVLRGSAPQSIPAAEVVRGDVLLFEPGDCVAADARLFAASELRIQEAALTGESMPAEKNAAPSLSENAALGDRRNLAFMGTTVAAGTGRALVTAVGMETEIGRIAALLAAEPEVATPLQRQLAGFGRLALWICLGLVCVVFALGWLRGMGPGPLFLTSVSLAVAAVPEGLPAIVTLALALGVRRMARRHALIRKLPAVETLGSAEVICTDKTGTLTQGEMTVRELVAGGVSFRVSGSGFAPAGSITAGGDAPGRGETSMLRTLASIHAGCNGAALAAAGPDWRVTGDPTEGALLVAARKAGLPPEYPDPAGLVREFPFDSDRKRRGMARRQADGGCRLLVNGAPELLLGLCVSESTAAGVRPLAEADRRRILAANADLAGRGLRVIGSAYRDFTDADALPDRDEAERDLVFAGLAGLQDPPRPEAQAAVGECRAAGIRVIMITGDHPDTALAVARELGLAETRAQILTGTEIDALDAAALRARVPEAAVCARVTAEHKLRIVKAWRERGAVTAMTGDGVNDAPALKGADIGIAMGKSGTEVAKQAADVVLADDNFASIVAAVEEGRGVYANIRKTLQYLLAGNAGELLVMILALALAWPVPLLPVHLLWINLVTDGLPALILAADPVDAGLMRRQPRRAGKPMADRRFLIRLLQTGCLTAGVSLAAFWIGWRAQGLDAARSYAFDTLVLTEVFRALAYRSGAPFWRSERKGLIRILLLIAGTTALQIVCHENDALERVLHLVPWHPATAAMMLGLGLIPLAVIEADKMRRRKRFRLESAAA